MGSCPIGPSEPNRCPLLIDNRPASITYNITQRRDVCVVLRTTTHLLYELLLLIYRRSETIMRVGFAMMCFHFFPRFFFRRFFIFLFIYSFTFSNKHVTVLSRAPAWCSGLVNRIGFFSAAQEKYYRNSIKILHVVFPNKKSAPSAKPSYRHYFKPFRIIFSNKHRGA